MPLLRYFALVGSLLLGLLYVAEALLGPADILEHQHKLSRASRAI